MRYKDSYNVCVENLAEGETDGLRYWIRLLESLTFAFSISYFFFIARPPSRCQAFNCIIITLLYLMLIACSITALVTTGK